MTRGAIDGLDSKRKRFPDFPRPRRLDRPFFKLQGSPSEDLKDLNLEGTVEGTIEGGQGFCKSTSDLRDGTLWDPWRYLDETIHEPPAGTQRQYSWFIEYDRFIPDGRDPNAMPSSLVAENKLPPNTKVSFASDDAEWHADLIDQITRDIARADKAQLAGDFFLKDRLLIESHATSQATKIAYSMQWQTSTTGSFTWEGNNGSKKPRGSITFVLTLDVADGKESEM